MPELPEVRTVSTHLNTLIKGDVIVSVQINLEKLIKNMSIEDFQNSIINSEILKIDNRSKFLLFFFRNENIMLSHLRMTGKYRVESKYIHQKHDHIIFKLKSGNVLVYKDDRAFGTFHIKNIVNYLTTKPLMNIALTTDKVDVDGLFNRLQNKRIAIKTAMLDQNLVAGLGNIYINEALWLTKIDPSTPSNKITVKQLKELLKASTEIMDLSTKLGGTTIHNFLSINNVEGGYQSHLKVHGKKDDECKKCKSLIQYKKVNGRGTFWCSNCQK